MRVFPALSLFVICVVCGATEPCKEVHSVGSAIRNARKLSGSIICLNGVILPHLNSRKTSSMLFELRPSSSTKGPKGQAIGLLEGDDESGIAKGFYKPDSFKLLNETTLGKGSLGKPVNVLIRGQLAYGKGFFKTRFAELPPGELYDPLRGLSYQVEFIIGEFLSAKVIR